MADRATAMQSEIRRHHDVEIPVDGETVAATRYEPVEHKDALPALLMYVPYPKDDMITYGAYDPLNRYLASHGYEVVVADMVGTGASTGRFDAMFGPNEGREAAAIVEWLADREWTNGRVGMYGKSYGGITSLAAAARRPDALDAIVPIHTPFMGYRNAYSYGSLFELQYIGTSWLTLMQALDAKPPSRRDQDGEWVDTWQTQLDVTSERDPFLFDFLDHDVDDGYWEDTRIPVERIETPTLAVGGTRDSYARDTVEYFEAIDAPKQMLLGPWRHTMPHRGRESAIGLRKKALAWFDHFLKDEPRAVVDEPPVHVWTERRDGSSADGVWRGIDRWPDATDANDAVRFALTTDGLQRPREYDTGRVEREYDPDYTVGVDSYRPPGASVPDRDTGADDARSLTFESAPLDRPLEFTGTGSATIRLRTTIDDPTLSVRVVDVAPDGSATMVTHGTKRARSDAIAELGESIGPGEDEITVPLKPTSYSFEAGHRVRIAVASALFPEFLSTGAEGTMTLLSAPDDASLVELPGGFRDGDEFEDGIAMPDPETSIPPDPERIVESETNWERTREDVGDTATIHNTSELCLELPHAAMARETDLTVSVAADDPSSVVARSEMEWTLEYPTEEITVVASNRFDRDFAEATTRVVRDDTTVFEEHWSRPVNR